MDYKMLIEHTRNMGRYAKEVLYETSVEEALVASADAIETLIAERDALMGQIRGSCAYCTNVRNCYTDDKTMKDCARNSRRNWQWRGNADHKEGDTT